MKQREVSEHHLTFENKIRNYGFGGGWYARSSQSRSFAPLCVERRFRSEALTVRSASPLHSHHNNPAHDFLSLKVLLILQGAGSFPDGVYASDIANPAILRSLTRIANNAYPGFRPATGGGETRQPSSASARGRAQTPPRLQRGGQGGVEKVDGPERVSCAVTFNCRKPCSPESRLISDLATEVAYLVGARASRCKSPRTPPSPRRRGEPAMPSKQQHEGSSAAKGAVGLTAGRQDTDQGAEIEREPEFPTSNATAVEPGGSGACNDVKPDNNVETPAKSGGRGTVISNEVISGRPGTYSGCGVNSCKGLGFAGQHGNVTGSIPHAPFVVREVDNGNGGHENAAGDNGKRETPGVNLGSDGSGAAGPGFTEEIGVGSSIGASPDVVVATPLALLSARETSFRNELIRRKAHYNLEGTRKKGGINSDGEPWGSPQASAILEQENRKACRGASAAVERGRSMKTPQRVRSSKQLGSSSPALVDIAESPLMASTRPTGVHPTPDPTCRRESDLRNRRSAGVTPGKKGGLDGGREYVTFARPAAHWSVTNSLSKSPRRARSKGVRVPNDADEGGGLVVGRFACRGYLLDPTFTDHNPIIMHSRLPLIAGGGGGLNQVPEDSTLAELIALPVAKGGGSSAGLKGVEPYRNVVKVLRHSIGVSGAREAGKNICDDDQGRPQSPVTFHQV